MIQKDSPIFVTGGTGFIGSYILRLLIEKGYTNIFALRRKSSRMDLVQNISDRIQWVEGDLENSHFLDDTLKGKEYIIHAAALVSFHAADREKLLETNATGTANLVNAALWNQAKKLVYISSIAALGRKEDSNVIDEEAEWQHSKHNSNYALSKHLAEMEVWRGTAEGLPAAIINPANVMGSGFWAEGTARTFQQIWDGFKFYTQGQTGFVDVRDVAASAVLLLESAIENQRFILSEANYSYEEIFKMIAKALQRPAPSIRVQSWMIPFARMGDWLKSKLQGQRPFLSKEIVRNSFQKWVYKNDLSKEVLEIEYIPIQKSIQETAAQFIAAQKHNGHPATLPF